MNERYDCGTCGQELETYVAHGRTFRRRKYVVPFPCQNRGCSRYGMEINIGGAVPHVGDD